MLRTYARWDALGTYAFLATDDPWLLERAERLARETLAEVDRACSRFRLDSDLSRVNRRPGRWVRVDPLLVAATTVALEAATATDGLVDPCLGKVIASLGYDAQPTVVRQRQRNVTRLPLSPHPDAWREVQVDLEGGIWLPAGVELDLGATGKAWAADLVAHLVSEELDCHAVVSLGGDVRIDGARDTPHPGWPVVVTERPGDDTASETVHLRSGALATSSTLARRWHNGPHENHHILDPRTGYPAAEVWRTVTVVADTCTEANTASTAALVLGDGAVDWLARRGFAARLVARNGSVRTVGDWPGDNPAPVLRFPTPRRGD